MHSNSDVPLPDVGGPTRGWTFAVALQLATHSDLSEEELGRPPNRTRLPLPNDFQARNGAALVALRKTGCIAAIARPRTRFPDLSASEFVLGRQSC